MKFNKIVIIAALIVCGNLVMSQDRYVTRGGSMKFFSTAPLEDIEAHTNKGVSIIDVKKGTVAVTVFIKTFEFEKKLMQEHFNENYMESDKYPKASFNGTFSSTDDIAGMVDGTYEVTAKGELTIHGEKKNIETPVTLTVKDGKLSASLVFMANVKEFGIKIPKVVVRNIAEEVEVTCNFDYEPYK